MFIICYVGAHASRVLNTTEFILCALSWLFKCSFYDIIVPVEGKGHPTRIPGKCLLLNQFIPGWLTKLNKFQILAGKLKI